MHIIDIRVYIYTSVIALHIFTSMSSHLHIYLLTPRSSAAPCAAAPAPGTAVALSAAAGAAPGDATRGRAAPPRSTLRFNLYARGLHAL